MKEIKGWVIVNESGIMLHWTIEKTKTKSIELAEDIFLEEWKNIEKIGYKCVKAKMKIELI